MNIEQFVYPAEGDADESILITLFPETDLERELLKKLGSGTWQNREYHDADDDENDRLEINIC